MSKNIVNIIFYRAENNIEKTKQLTIQAFIHYVAYYGAFTVFRKVMQHKEIWFVLDYKNVHFREITIICAEQNI